MSSTESPTSSSSNASLLEDNKPKISIEVQCRERAIQLFEELSSHCEMKTCGFKFTFAKDHPHMQQLLDLVWGYQIICTPPEIGLITDNSFTCEVVRTTEKGIAVPISLEAMDTEHYDGSPVYMGTEYMGYRKKTFGTNKEVIEQFGKILASKSESKIIEAELHKESGCCVYGLCTLPSRTGHEMSYFLKACKGNKEKIIEAVKEALKKSDE